MQDTIIATSSTVNVGYDFLTPLLRLIFGSEGLISGVSLTGVVGFANLLWLIFVVISYIVVFIFLYLYVYASIQKSKLEEFETEQIKAQEHAFASTRGAITKSDRLGQLQIHIDSDNPNDWKLALIEADIILDEILKQQGYAGASLGERLRSISPSSLASLDDAWQAHKLRNQIAHGGVDFVLTQKLAKETINRYLRVFADLGIL
jgi:uncharacterized membrane protein